MCKAVRAGLDPTWETPWVLGQAIAKFRELHQAHKFITTEACLPYDPNQNLQCSKSCSKSTLPVMTQGSFKALQLFSIWRMQEHIRLHGSIVCDMDIYADFKAFFSHSRGGVYKGEGELLMPTPTLLVNTTHDIMF
jgi:hypothetical protein